MTVSASVNIWGHLYIVGGNVVQSLWKSAWKFLKKLEIELSHEPIASVLNTFSKESTFYYRDTYSFMFTVNLSM